MKSLCEDIDRLGRRCPRLGGPITFGYCRTAEANGSPCFKVLDCWWERFDVVGYFRQRLTGEAFDRLRCPPCPNKSASLVELIRQAQQRIKS